jgi:N-acetylmuramoyl-L-alanine amidase
MTRPHWIVAFLIALIACGIAGRSFGAEESGPKRAILDGPGGRIAARLLTMDGIPYVSTTDLAAALGATKRWSPQSRRLELRFTAGGNEHHFDLFVDTPTAILDQNPRNLPGPSRLDGGVVFVSLSGLSEALAGALPGGTRWNPERMTLHLGESSDSSAEIDLTESGARTVLRATAAEAPRLESSQAGFIVLFPGVSAEAELRVPAPVGLISGLRVENAPEGARLHLQAAPAALGFRVDPGPESWSLTFSADSVDVASGSFAPLAEAAFAAGEAVSEADRAREFRRIVIDAGHGGWERGAVGELIEKSISLEVAEELRRVLEEDHGFEVILTRDGDEEIPFDRRAEIVNASGADLCVTIHANGSFSSGVEGPRVLIFRGGSVSPVASKTIAGRRLEILPWSGVQARHGGASERLAESIAAEIGAGRGIPVLKRPLRALSSVDMPAVAVECGFVTNTGDAADLASAEKRSDLARAIARGIESFVHRLRGEKEL